MKIFIALFVLIGIFSLSQTSQADPKTGCWQIGIGQQTCYQGILCNQSVVDGEIYCETYNECYYDSYKTVCSKGTTVQAEHDKKIKQIAKDLEVNTK